MKKLLLCVLICSTTLVFGQKFDFGLSIGTGKSYLFESIDKSVNVRYSLPMSLITELKFTPKDKNWGIMLRLNSIESTVTGQNWVNNTPLNGYINSFTTSLLLEKEIAKKKHSYGVNFGFGLTKETLQPQQYDPGTKTTQVYPSISVGGNIAFILNKDLDFQILPVLFWQDPFKSIGVLTRSRTANLAGEDLTLLLNFGLRYRITK